MTEFLWRVVAWIVCRPAVTARLIRRAQAHPYADIKGPDGSLYMWRGWVFNPYGKGPNDEVLPARWQWLPSIRVHWILRPDSDRHLHDHPWNARTIILGGWYEEQRPWSRRRSEQHLIGTHLRNVGYTGRLLFGQFHRISKVSPTGVLTLFFTWKKRGTWGFDVDGVKVPYREYLDAEGRR